MRAIADRETMYRLMLSQLLYDGYQKEAMPLAATLGMSGAIPPPSDKLFRWFLLGRAAADDTGARSRLLDWQRIASRT